MSARSLDGENDELLLSAVREAFYSGGLTNRLEDFAEENACKIRLDLEENLLEYTDLHLEFNSIIERHLCGVIKQHGSTPEEFFRLVRKAIESSEVSFDDSTFFIEIFTATTDFEIFIEMMRETAQNQHDELEEEKKETKSHSH